MELLNAVMLCEAGIIIIILSLIIQNYKKIIKLHKSIIDKQRQIIDEIIKKTQWKRKK